jgi:hypothetical protein
MGNKQKDEDSNCPQPEPKGTLRDFILPIVEFLGILVPGVVFIFAFIPAVIYPTGLFLSLFSDQPSALLKICKAFVDLFRSPGFGNLTLLFIFAYVVGHLFFRQDPKIPDQHSFKKVIKTIGEEGPVRLCEKEKKYNQKLNKPNDYNLEFPYRYLYEYLQDRGMYHLASLVPWRGNNPKTYRLRTKHFINTIKVRLEFLFPYQYFRILRNEAHIRLMSSMWYATRSLLFLSAFGSLLGFLTIAIINIKINSPNIAFSVYDFILPILIFLCSFAVKNNIESFLHYQRIREIVFILEAAYFAQQLYPNLKVFEKNSAQ